MLNHSKKANFYIFPCTGLQSNNRFINKKAPERELDYLIVFGKVAENISRPIKADLITATVLEPGIQISGVYL